MSMSESSRLVVLVCGDRNWTDRARIEAIFRRMVGRYGTNILVVHGDCRGADKLAGSVARSLGLDVHPEPAQWNVHDQCRCPQGAPTCKAAGPRRNQRMLDRFPEIAFVLAFHNQIESSTGTADMKRRTERAGKPVYVVRSGSG